MSRKIKKYIPKGSDYVQEKFINFIMRDGKKLLARRIFKDTLEEIKKKGSKDPLKIFKKAIENVTPSMEVRPKRVGGGVYQIPVEVKESRKLTLAFRWIMTAARSKKGKPFYISLAGELIDASDDTGVAIKKKEDSHKMAEANKAFAHLARF